MIAAYARQAVSVTPDIIEAIAIDFRLGVQTRPVQRKKTSDELDLRKAAKTMLELYAHLRGEQAWEEELAVRMPVRVNEP